MSTAYGKPTYWDERYANFSQLTFKRDLEPFDWYQRFSGIKHLVLKSVKLNSRILIVGCGTSILGLGEEMLQAGYKDIVNIDISPVVVSHLSEKYKETPGLTFKTMDVMALEFQDSFFDAVIDKGTLDAILCGENSTASSEKTLSEIHRVLKPGGTYLVISYGPPKTRTHILDKPAFGWKTEVSTLDKPFGNAEGEDVHYAYTITKVQ